MPLTLITGASSGIGMEMAKVAARNGDDLLLVARRLDKLQSISEEITRSYPVKVYILPKDLSVNGAPEEVSAWCKANSLHIDHLVNNAGFGDLSAFSDADPVRLQDMIAVNISALTELTRLFLPAMLKRGSGRIMNVSSLAAFQPGPLMAVYYATKSYVLSFSEALRIEVEKSGVTVTTLCPGPTDNEFKETANMTRSRLMTKQKNPESKQVAEFGYRAMMNGKPVAVHGVMNAFFAFTTRLTPRSWAARIAKYLNSSV